MFKKVLLKVECPESREVSLAVEVASELNRPWSVDCTRCRKKCRIEVDGNGMKVTPKRDGDLES